MVVLFLAATVLGAASAKGTMLRPAKERPDIIEVGDPVLVGRNVLEREIRVNTSLRDYIELYGWPDYAEIQEITVLDPWAAYEVRIYYLHRDQYLVFGRVHVAPSVDDYGVLKYDGHIDPDTLDRLLTAAPPAEVEPAPVEVAPPPPPAPPPVKMSASTVDAPDAEAEDVQILAADAAEVPPAEDEGIVVAAAVAEPAERSSAYPDLSHIVNRLEVAADRAAAAAEDAERASLAATASANRATSAVEKLLEEYQE